MNEPLCTESDRESESRSRRDFLKTAGKGLGTIAVAAQLPGLVACSPADRDVPGEAPRSPQDRPIGFALCGLGGLSTNQIAPALAKTRHARLAGVITGSPAKGEAWAAEHGIPTGNVYHYDGMHEMAGNPDIDVVYVVTPNALHHRHTLAAARAGKHVLIEKPMAVSVTECEEMIGVGRQEGVKLAVAYRLQFEPHHLECMRLAREKEFGDTRVIEAGLAFRIGDPDQWRLKAELAGGGALMDVGIYALQACRYLTGEEPVQLSAVETKTDPVKFSQVDETIAWQMTFPSGAIATCTTSYNVSGINRFRVYGETGWFGMEPAFSYGGLRGQRSDDRPLRFEEADHFASEMDDFSLCILEGRESKVAGEEGLRDLRVIERIYESIRLGQSVTL